MKGNQDFPSPHQEVSISRADEAPSVPTETGRLTDIAFHFRPKYFATIHGKTIASASIVDLIRQGASLDIDFSALNVFLRSGFYIGTNTLFRSVHAQEVPNPASFGVKPTDANRSTTIEQYIELFRQSIERQIKRFGRLGICMGLSGGRDSRHILLELCRFGVKPDVCWTIYSPNSPLELTIAQQVALKAGVPHVGLIAAASVESEWYKNWATHFESTEHGWAVAAIPTIHGHGVIYDGMAGDVLSAGHFLTDQGVRLVREGRIDEFVERIIVRSGPVPLVRDQSLFPLETALEAVSAEVRRHLSMPNPIGSFYLWNRTRRTIGSSAFGLLCPSGQKTSVPYLDDDLFGFLSSIPDSMLVDHELHTDTIRRAFPEYADIPYAYKVKSQNPSPTNRRLAVETARYLLRYSCALLSKNMALGHLTRALLVPWYLDQVNWVHTISVYLVQAGLLSSGLRFDMQTERSSDGRIQHEM